MLCDLPLPARLRAVNIGRRQYREYVAGDGVTAATRAHVESIYFDTLARLQALFERQTYDG